MKTKELAKRIDELTAEGFEYQTSADEAVDIAYQAFCMAAEKLGLTGFQAGYCALKFLAKVNRIDGPFIYLKASDLCYPQYDLHQKLDEFIKSSQPWVKEQCTKYLAEPLDYVHLDVIKHWKGKSV